MKDILKVCLIGMTADAPIRERQILLAPYVLKRYAENNVVPKGSVEIKVFDFPYNAAPGDMAFGVLRSLPNLVGLSFYVWNYSELIECAKILKRERKDLIILAGGPMVSFNAEEIIKEYPYIDAVSYEDTRGEVIFKDFLQSLVDCKTMAEAKGIIFRTKDNKIVKSQHSDGNILRCCESSPFINNDIVFDDEKDFYITLETAKGCLSNCGYCCWGGGRKKIEYYPMDRVFKEIEIIYNSPNIKHVLFTDSNMLREKKRLIEIIKKMSAQAYYNKISTRMHLDILSIDEELAKALSTVPGFSFDFGLQTSNPVALRYIGNYRANADKFKEKILLLKECVPNLKFGVDLMIGLPGDTLSWFKKTLEFCLSLEPSRFFIAYPICLLPGTRFYEERERLKLNYSRTLPQVITSTDDFPQSDIFEAVRLSTWLQILIYYYPAVSEFFYTICRDKSDGERFSLMEKWVNLLDSRVNLFSGVNISEVDNNPVTKWYATKGNLLERASCAEVAHIIYSSIYELHNGIKHNLFYKNIVLGLKAFSYYKEHNMNPVGRNALEFLPLDVYQDYTFDDLRKVHSIFRR